MAIFLLSDWVGIPNLAGRSGSFLQDTVLSAATWRKVESPEPKNIRRFLLIYGILAAGYRLLLTLAILQLVRQVSQQWQVEFAGNLFCLIILMGFIVFPSLHFMGRMISFEASDPERQSSMGRLFASLSVFGLLWMLPMPHSLMAPAFVQPSGVSLYAGLPGRIEPTVAYGQTVSEGDVLARLENPELERSAAGLKGRVEGLRLRIAALENSPLTANSEVLPTLQQSYQSAQGQLAEFEKEQRGLIIVSPADGIFFPPIAVAGQKSTDLPERWTGTPVEPRNQGAWIDRGVQLGHVGDSNAVKLLVCVEESEIQLVKLGLAVEFLPLGGCDAVSGSVREVSQLTAEEVPAQMGIAGLLNGRPSESGFVPAAVTYLVTVEFDDDTDLRGIGLYSAGHARIHASSASLLNRIVRYLRRTFS